MSLTDFALSGRGRVDQLGQTKRFLFLDVVCRRGHTALGSIAGTAPVARYSHELQIFNSDGTKH